MNTRTTLVCGLATLVVLTSLAMSQRPLHAVQQRSAAEEATDTRERIRLAPAERDAVLAEMRTMLQSLSGIVHGLVAGDLVMVEEAARTSSMRAAIDPQLQKKLPPHFLQLGRRVHTRFDQLADAIKTGATKDDVLRGISSMMGFMFVGWILWILVLIGMLVGIGLGIYWLVRQWTPGPRDSALQILRERYARGEIGREEFEARRQDLIT